MKEIISYQNLSLAIGKILTGILLAEFSGPSAYDIAGAFCGIGLSTVNSSSSMGRGGVGLLTFDPFMIVLAYSRSSKVLDSHPSMNKLLLSSMFLCVCFLLLCSTC